MIRLYDCYGEDDKILLIGKKEELGISELKEKDFEFTEEVERDYLVFAYNEEHKIINNGFMHLYDVRILKDLENVIVYYDEEGNLEEVGIEKEEQYRLCYIKYTPEKFRADMKKVFEEGSEFFKNRVEEGESSLNNKLLEFNYFYNGENIDLYVKEDLNEIHLGEDLLNYFEALVLSVARDELADDEEVIEYIVKAIFNKVKDLVEEMGGELQGPNKEVEE